MPSHPPSSLLLPSLAIGAALLLLATPPVLAHVCDGTELLCPDLTSEADVVAWGGSAYGTFSEAGFMPANTGGIDWYFDSSVPLEWGRFEVDVTGLVPNGVAEDDGGKVSIFEACSQTEGEIDFIGLQKMTPDYHDGNNFRYGLDDDGLADNWDAAIITAADMGCFYSATDWLADQTHHISGTWSGKELSLTIDSTTCHAWGNGETLNAPDLLFTLANRCTHYSNQQAVAWFNNFRLWAGGDGGGGDDDDTPPTDDDTTPPPADDDTSPSADDDTTAATDDDASAGDDDSADGGIPGNEDYQGCAGCDSGEQRVPVWSGWVALAMGMGWRRRKKREINQEII